MLKHLDSRIVALGIVTDMLSRVDADDDHHHGGVDVDHPHHAGGGRDATDEDSCPDLDLDSDFEPDTDCSNLDKLEHPVLKHGYQLLTPHSPR